MVDPIVLQIIIGVFGVLSFVALAANRIFIGAILASIGQPVWIWASWSAEHWGAVVVLSLFMVAYLLAVIVRWPRKAPAVVSNDESEWLGI